MQFGDIKRIAQCFRKNAEEYCLDNDHRWRLGAPLSDYRYDTDNSSLHNDMNHWGGIPGLGLFTGVARTAYGAVKFSAGLSATVLFGLASKIMRLVNFVARNIFKIPISNRRFVIAEQCTRWYQAAKAFTFDGGAHLIRGIGEAVTLGCHRPLLKWSFKLLLRNETTVQISRDCLYISRSKDVPKYFKYLMIQAGTEVRAEKELAERAGSAVEA